MNWSKYHITLIKKKKKSFIKNFISENYLSFNDWMCFKCVKHKKHQWKNYLNIIKKIILIQTL